MNIFALDDNPVYAALAQHDRHVVKMILESAQMLSVCVGHKDMTRYSQLLDDASRAMLYKPTHMNHPCAVWVRQSDANFTWLVVHMDALVSEYHRRFPGKTHACSRMRYMFAAMVGRILGKGFYTKNHEVSEEALELALQHDPFACAMPLNYRDIESEVQSYRNYYVAEKCAGNRWTRPIHQPAWLLPHMTIHTPESPAPLRRVPKPLSPRQLEPTFAVATEKRGPLGLNLLKKESR